jgi:hypothetical protein
MLNKGLDLVVQQLGELLSLCLAFGSSVPCHLLHTGYKESKFIDQLFSSLDELVLRRRVLHQVI